MWLASRILTGLAVLGLIWFFWPFGSEKDVITLEQPPPTGHDGRLFTTPLREPSPPEKKKSAEAPPEATDPEATDPEATDPETMEPAAPTPTPRLFHRVVVQDGGTLQAGDTLIVLDGIIAHGVGAQCKDTQGRNWHCGTRARAALRRLIQGRAVRCQVPNSSEGPALTARCTVRGKDLSHWMVSQGWAKPTEPAETRLAKAAEAARKRKAGIWR